jgi:nucleotide-binding universal stress UspA family protein
MFARILCANDGSERAFRALGLAITIAKAAGAELHMVSVEEIDYMPEFIEEIREETATAARRFHKAHQRARALAEEHQVGLRIHLLTGDLKADLLVIGATGHSHFYERMLGSRADRLVHLAPCPVLVVR